MTARKRATRKGKPRAKKSAARRTRAVDVPLPGSPVRGSSGGRPIMAALDLLGRRWNLRVLWELREGAIGFRDLRGRCDDMSPDTLSTRLAELELSGLVERDDAGAWRLTPLGHELGPAMRSLDEWARNWADSLDEA